MKIILILILTSSTAYAIDSSKCSKMLNEGLYKKYKWAGMGESNAKAITAETKSAGSSTATSNISTEGTTALSDPVYYTNVSKSQTQSTSSWGDCSLFALQERKKQRELYVHQNFYQIKKDIANGQGYHIETLAWFSLCEDQFQNEFNKTLQNKFDRLSADTEYNFTKNLDLIIEDNGSLKNKCANLSKI